MQPLSVLFKVPSLNIFSLYLKHSKLLEITKRSLIWINYIHFKDIRVIERKQHQIIIVAIWAEVKLYEAEGTICSPNFPLHYIYHYIKCEI